MSFLWFSISSSLKFLLSWLTITANLKLVLRLLGLKSKKTLPVLISDCCTDRRRLWDEWLRNCGTIEDSCMQIYDSPLCSLCLIMCTFPTNQTRQESRLAGAQLLIVTVCSLAKRALMRGVGERLRTELFMLLKRRISSVHCVTVWTVVSAPACRSRATSPTYHQWFLYSKKWEGWCSERALKLDFVPLCMITKARDPWCIAVSC